ncbi:hypothetical protein OG225_41880 (plasmid) [Nocardia sp. NBC_01377]|uniref:hypothetical protein n=1 Tax=Nocardia sp. NBC_01377 TaxID=2903595 RepID=UPI002F909EDF
MTGTPDAQPHNMNTPLVLTWWTIGVYECEDSSALDAILAGNVDGRYTVWDIDEDDRLLHIGPDAAFRSSQDLERLEANARQAMPRLPGARFVEVLNVTRTHDNHVIDLAGVNASRGQTGSVGTVGNEHP